MSLLGNQNQLRLENLPIKLVFFGKYFHTNQGFMEVLSKKTASNKGQIDGYTWIGIALPFNLVFFHENNSIYIIGLKYVHARMGINH